MPKVQWVDEERLRKEIRQIKPGDWLFKVLKEELMAMGYWRNKPRGIPESDHWRKIQEKYYQD